MERGWKLGQALAEMKAQEGKLAQAITTLRRRGVSPLQYKHLPPAEIIKLAGVK